MRRVAFLVMFGLAMLQASSVMAATSTTLANAVAEFDGTFRVGLYILGLAALMTIIYSVARNRYGIHWDEAISTVIAGSLGASAIIVLGWVGVTAGAPLDPVCVDVPTLVVELPMLLHYVPF